MRTSDSRIDPSTDPRAKRNAHVRMYLAAYWVVWAFWIVIRPRADASSFTREARIWLAVFGFAIVSMVSYGLLREWRWPVTASRALLAASALVSLVGPAGRSWVAYAVDLAFLFAGAIPAFFMLQIGTASLQRNGMYERAREARTKRYLQKRDEKRR